MRDNINRLYRIEGKIKFLGRAAFQLLYAKNASILLLEKIYYKKNLPCLSRKRFKVEQALDIIDRKAGMLER